MRSLRRWLRVTGLESYQITAVDANANDIFIDYVGARPGMGGGHGRLARMTYDTKTGRLVEDVTL